MIKIFKPLVTNTKMTKPRLVGMRFLKLMLVVFVLSYPTTSQAAKPKSSPIQPSKEIQPTVSQPRLMNEAQNNYQLYIPLVIGSAISLASNSCSGNCYYVDSVNGSDSNPGNSIKKPWRTLAPVNAKHFLPGDIVNFKRGSSWTGGLTIDNSGKEGNPIVFTAYGTGARPVLRNPGDSSHLTRAIIVNANWVVVSGFLLQDTSESGVRIGNNANHNIIKDLEVTNVGMGVSISGQYNLVTGNYFHDLHMVVNTPGGAGDYGAIGVAIFNSNNEVSYNKMVNCKAPSYDYGTDGGAVELYGTVNNSYIHHNWAYENEGFMEIGSSNNSGSANDVNVSYNIVYNSGRIFGFHLTGNYGSNVHNFVADNNTFIDVTDYPKTQWSTLYFDKSITPDIFIMRNNIFYIGNYWYVADADNRGWDFTHENNIYFMASSNTKLGFSLGSGEEIANPLFVNMNNQDFHLKTSSPAIDAGLDLGYDFSFDDKHVPTGKEPDIGAYEYQGSP